jgi:DNA-binding CsgD family transcriptional regulator
MNIDQFSKSLNDAYTFSDIEDLSELALTRYGFPSYFMSGETNNPGRPNVFGKPRSPQFLEYYRTSNFGVIDPVARNLKFGWFPVAWDALEIYKKSTGRCADFFKKSLEIGHERGVSTAIRGPHGREYRLVAVYDGTQANFQKHEGELSHTVYLIAAHIANAIERIDRVALSDNAPPLTPREAECLAWSCQGKTAWETATILGISERTVHFHLQNTIKKMGCASKYECCHRARELSLVKLH